MKICSPVHQRSKGWQHSRVHQQHLLVINLLGLFLIERNGTSFSQYKIMAHWLDNHYRLHFLERRFISPRSETNLQMESTINILTPCKLEFYEVSYFNIIIYRFKGSISPMKSHLWSRFILSFFAYLHVILFFSAKTLSLASFPMENINQGTSPLALDTPPGELKIGTFWVFWLT